MGENKREISLETFIETNFDRNMLPMSEFWDVISLDFQPSPRAAFQEGARFAFSIFIGTEDHLDKENMPKAKMFFDSIEKFSQETAKIYRAPIIQRLYPLILAYHEVRAHMNRSEEGEVAIQKLLAEIYQLNDYFERFSEKSETSNDPKPV